MNAVLNFYIKGAKGISVCSLLWKHVCSYTVISIHRCRKKNKYLIKSIFLIFSCSKNTHYQIDSLSRQEANVTRCVYGHTNNTNVPKKVVVVIAYFVIKQIKDFKHLFPDWFLVGLESYDSQ